MGQKMNDGSNVISTHKEVMIIKHLSDVYYLHTHVHKDTMFNPNRAEGKDSSQ